MTHAADGDARMPLRKEKQQYVGMLYCLPYVVVFLMGTILPILYALYLSFFKERMVGGSRFVGLKNFVRAVSDAKLWESFGRVSLYFRPIGTFVVLITVARPCGSRRVGLSFLSRGK